MISTLTTPGQNGQGTVHLKALPTLAWPDQIKDTHDALNQLKAHEIINQVTDAFQKYGQALAELDNIPAPGLKGAGPQRMDYNPEPGDVLMVDQYIGHGKEGQSGRLKAAELRFNPKDGSVYKFVAVIDESNQFTCIGPDSSNPLFIRMKDGHSTRVQFDTASQYITRLEDF